MDGAFIEKLTIETFGLNDRKAITSCKAVSYENNTYSADPKLLFEFKLKI